MISVLRTAYKREFPHIYRGVVEDNIDPENLGRCKVRVPSIHGELNFSPSSLPWARPIVLSPVKSGRGSVNIPDIGDIVWVFFEGAVREFPVYLGGTYAREELFVDPDIVDFYIEDDNKISYDRKNKVYKISMNGMSIELNQEDIKIIGDTQVQGNLSVSGNLKVSGTTTLSNLVITGSCNKECNCS